MIYITGDTHGERARISPAGIPGEESFGAGDTLIICGDFGYLLSGETGERDFLDALGKKPYTICFLDGNHENFPLIFSYPKEEWHGGYAHRIRKNIFHLMRGQVFDISGYRFFVMGGGYSRDRYTRIEGRSWWAEELPDNDEYREATHNLSEVGMKVDYILTHTAPREVIRRMGGFPDPHEAELTGFLEWVMHEVDFRRWFFGHWHTDKEVYGKFRALWFDVETIPEKNEKSVDFLR